ncbi:FecR family protein [Wenyingzhuangia aestuarii]|uniref:FecR family protein n=1 Tax=Wenyingzhuangia aestuarii TaxID=1647582 RepID=UPI00143BABCE|nr:FecR family protein [Wenyingzhuangia aestuarii]NJB81826.1 hypothetical protein [Wenyingzhuangia aestuarii]
MIPSEIENSILHYLTGNATKQELALLERWIKIDNHNKELFNDYLKVYYLTNTLLTKTTPKNFKAKELARIQKAKNNKQRSIVYLSLKYAAILILFVGSSYFLYNRNIVKDTFSASSNQITLQLANGQVEIINEKSSKEIVDIHGNKIGIQEENRIVYHTKSTSKTPVYNQLSVPYGKQFELVLSDGTTITINAGTTIEYPTQFASNQKREVSIQGEAFFKVAKDSLRPFIVKANDLKVRVLGTQFNVSAYPEEPNIATVLVEGLVGLYNNNYYNSTTATLLTPGFKGLYNEKEGSISKEKVDTRIYTGWRTGQLIFRNIPFKNIIKRLERSYNIQIINHNKQLNHEYFNAAFNSKKEDIYKVLNTFQKSYNFEYTTNKNQIIIH